jgi:hypothetical protein
MPLTVLLPASAGVGNASSVDNMSNQLAKPVSMPDRARSAEFIESPADL